MMKSDTPLKIGIDVHGVADAMPHLFAPLCRLLVENGHEVHILTGSEHTPELECFLRDKLGLIWTHLFSIISHHCERGSEMTRLDHRKIMDEELWNRTKAAYCERWGIHLHLDDSAVYGKHFSTPYARLFTNARPAVRKRIAIIGGSFNPVTAAHLDMAHAIRRHLPEIDEVWLMPAYRHPFQKHHQYAAQRIRMIRLVERSWLRYFGYEIDNRLTGVTHDTFVQLLDDPAYRTQYTFCMAIGSDCALDFDEKWRHASALAEMIPFIIIPRPGYDLSAYHGLLRKAPHRILTEAEMRPVSATEVRQRIAAHRSIDGLVPEPVKRYILDNRLYRNPPAPEPSDSASPDCRCGEGLHPAVSVVMAVCTILNERISVLLVQEPDAPGQPRWTIPGRPVRPNQVEGLAETAAHLVSEKTGLTNLYTEQLKTYGDTALGSPRDSGITVAYFALIPAKRAQEPAAAPTGSARWFPLHNTAAGALPGGRIASGHSRILQDLRQRLEGKISYTPIAFELLSEPFTWPELRQVYEIILGKKIDATNFKRKIRATYRIKELKKRSPKPGIGRPPIRLRYEGVKEIYPHIDRQA